MIKKTKSDFSISKAYKLIQIVEKFSTLLLAVIIIIGLAACEGKRISQDKTSGLQQGSFSLTLLTDSADILFSLELVTAKDGALYGYLESETLEYEAPIALDSTIADSSFFHTYTHQL